MADSTARFSNWFQIISNVAIIVGLGLVIYELNQGKRLVLAQLTSDDASSLRERNMTIMGESPQDAIAKADLHPGRGVGRISSVFRTTDTRRSDK